MTPETESDIPFSTAARGRRGRPTPAQLVSLGLVAIAFGLAAWLVDERPSPEVVELLPGSQLPSGELAVVEAALDRAELGDHRTEAGRVWVPRQRHAAYMRALVDAEALPREFGSSLRRVLDDDSPWRSRAAQEERLRIAIQDELVHVIRSMPGIEQAAVLYDAGDRTGFGKTPQRPATASVNLRMHADAPLEPQRVQAIRVLVAASISGLDPERVAVTDLRDGRVHSGPLGQDTPAEADPDLARRAAHERHLSAKIRQAISFVEGAVVDVTVAFLEDEPRRVAQRQPEPGPEPASGPEHGGHPAAAAIQSPVVSQRAADANAPAEISVEAVKPMSDRRTASAAGRAAAQASEPTAKPAPDPAAGTPDLEPEVPPRIIVTIAVPEPSLRLVAGLTQQPGGEATAGSPRELLAAHVRNLLPAPNGLADHRIIVTTFPLPAGQAPRRGEQPAANAAQTSRGHSLGRLVDSTLDAVRGGRFTEVPPQAWMAVAAGVVAIALWFLLREPTERAGRPQRPRRSAAGPLDWDGVDSPLTAETGPLADRDASEQPRGVAA